MENPILIADDDPVVREILGAILESLGQTFDSASSGQETKEKVTNRLVNEAPYLLLFLDIQMGDMTGIQVIQQLKNTFPDFVAKVVFLSAHAKQDVDKIHGQADEDYYLEKPFTSEQIAEIIDEIFQ
ncbi:MAG: response regulator [Deltaproteobacteria bacterium]|nr:response regulator [Deltaproteobacteria bacterium]